MKLYNKENKIIFEIEDLTLAVIAFFIFETLISIFK